MNVTIFKNGDSLDQAYSTFTTASGSVWDSSINFMTSTSATSAFITGITFSVQRAGTPAYTAGVTPGRLFYPVDNNSYPCTVSTTYSGCSSINLAISGVDGAIGGQVLTYSVTVSSQALTGQAGNVEPYSSVAVDLSARTQTFTTTVSCLNTPYPLGQGNAGYLTGDGRANGAFASKGDFLRLWNLQG